MKSKKKNRKLQAARRRWVAVVGLCAAAGAVSAADTNAPAVLTPQQFFEGGEKSYDNWVDFGVGGFFADGNRAQAQQARQSSLGLLGGINDFHYQKDVVKDTTLTLDGRALSDDNEYRLKMGVSNDKYGFLRLSYDEFRTWYNGNGGYYPPGGQFYSTGGNGLGLNRGDFSVEGGLTMAKIPKITFKYSHEFRAGEKSSTIWGNTDPAIGVEQGLSPSVYKINEHSDSFQLDVSDKIKATDVGAGIRYESGKINDGLQIDQFPGEPVEQKITDKQDNSYNLFSAHGSTETWLDKNLMFSSGLSYSTTENSLAGTRIYGSDFDVGYVPGALAGQGYYNLGGESRLYDYVADLNLFYRPMPHLTITPSIRVAAEDADESVNGMETLGVNAAVPFDASGDSSDLDVRERLDVSYNGITNWVFYARGNLTEGNGNLNETGGLVPIGGIGSPAVMEQMDEDRFFQKYSIGARWYPLRQVTIDAGAYYKDDSYSRNTNLDSTLNNSFERYPGYLFEQNFQTYDGNVRVTWRPLRTLTLGSRYEYQLSTIRTGPDALSGLPKVESSRMTSHIFAEDATWSPWSRLSLTAGINYVLSKTTTPTSDATSAILNADNNYWMANLSSSFVIDDKSDLNLAYFYYRANDYNDIAPNGVPYGSGAEDQGITVALVRRLTKNVRASIKYGWSHGSDDLYGGNDNYSAQFVYTSVQYRF